MNSNSIEQSKRKAYGRIGARLTVHAQPSFDAFYQEVRKNCVAGWNFTKPENAFDPLATLDPARSREGKNQPTIRKRDGYGIRDDLTNLRDG